MSLCNLILKRTHKVLYVKYKLKDYFSVQTNIHVYCENVNITSLLKKYIFNILRLSI